MRDRSHDTAMAEHFRADPTYAAELHAEVRRDGNPGELAILLRQIDTFLAGNVRLHDAERGRTLLR